MWDFVRCPSPCLRSAPDPTPHLLRGHEGRLIFETLDGKDDPITAEQLSTLLRKHHIPIMVLNACQSAMVDAEAKSAFASIAAALQRAGVRSVVAMAYTLYVSGAEVFLPAFYHRLFQTGQIAEAVRAGRQAMLRARGTELRDRFEHARGAESVK
jgi:CHAT domain-containing protein